MTNPNPDHSERTLDMVDTAEPNPDLDARIEHLRQQVLQHNRRNGRHQFQKPKREYRAPYKD